MSSILETLTRQLDGNAVGEIGRQLGVNKGVAGTAVASALPLLLGALARNSAKDHGASALAAALDRDHDGSILDNLGGFLGSGQAQSDVGPKILGHVLGGQRGAVESSLASTSGLDSQSTAKLLAMLAPLVLGAVGRAKREQKLDASGLAHSLQREREHVAKASPQLGGLLGMLDQDGDGSVMDDVAKAGAGLLGKLMRG